MECTCGAGDLAGHKLGCPRRPYDPRPGGVNTEATIEARRQQLHAAGREGKAMPALPSDPVERKAAPIASGVLDYFPLAIAEIAKVSLAATQQHHPDKPMHWDRNKSTDHADCIARHLMDRGKIDTDKQRHSAKMAWRALALLQVELESER